MSGTNGDGRMDLVAGSGFGAAQVRIFDLINATNPPVLEEFIAYDGSGGVWVAGTTGPPSTAGPDGCDVTGGGSGAEGG